MNTEVVGFECLSIMRLELCGQRALRRSVEESRKKTTSGRVKDLSNRREARREVDQA